MEDDRTQKQPTWKVPANSKTIGELPTDDRIYVEDYVITYLSQITKTQKQDCIAALFGLYDEVDNVRGYMVYGAIGIPYWQDIENCLSAETVNHVIAKKRQHFAGLFFLGWAFLFNGQAQLPEIAADSGKIDTAFGKPRIFMTQNGYREERIFYLYRRNEKPRELSGYGVFYERNMAMQSYLIDWHEKNEMNTPENAKETAVDCCKSALDDRKYSRSHSLLSSFALAVTLLLLITVSCMGILTLNQYDKMKDVEQALYRLENEPPNEEEEPQSSIIENEQEPQQVLQPTSVVYVQSEEIPGAADEHKTDDEVIVQKEQVPELSTGISGEPEKGRENSVSDIEQEIHITYVVVKGDTLSEIAKEHYGSVTYVGKICEANGIEDENAIYYGQIIHLP